MCGFDCCLWVFLKRSVDVVHIRAVLWGELFVCVGFCLFFNQWMLHTFLLKSCVPYNIQLLKNVLVAAVILLFVKRSLK